jgi:hypothetical protein
MKLGTLSIVMICALTLSLASKPVKPLASANPIVTDTCYSVSAFDSGTPGSPSWGLSCGGSCDSGSCMVRAYSDPEGSFEACGCMDGGHPGSCCQIILRDGIPDTFGECRFCPANGQCTTIITQEGHKANAKCI